MNYYFFKMKSNIKYAAILVLLSLVWGSSFILMKRVMFDKATGDAIFSSKQVGAMRMLFASSALLPIGLRSLMIISSFKIGLSLAVVSLAGSFIPAFLFTYAETGIDRKSTRLNSSHVRISYAVFCLKKKKKK